MAGRPIYGQKPGELAHDSLRNGQAESGIGVMAGGVLAEALGARVTLLIAAGGIVLSSGWLVFSPVRRLQDRPERAKIEKISG
jgi:hypothetical protein